LALLNLPKGLRKGKNDLNHDRQTSAWKQVQRPSEYTEKLRRSVMSSALKAELRVAFVFMAINLRVLKSRLFLDCYKQLQKKKKGSMEYVMPLHNLSLGI
jgi:hypothetical protein